MRLLLVVLLAAVCLAASGCGLFSDFFNPSDNSNTADEAEIYQSKTGRVPY